MVPLKDPQTLQEKSYNDSLENCRTLSNGNLVCWNLIVGWGTWSFQLMLTLRGKSKRTPIFGDFTSQKSSQQTRLRNRYSFEESNFADELFNHFDQHKWKRKAWTCYFWLSFLSEWINSKYCANKSALMLVPSELSGYHTIISSSTIAVGMIPDQIHFILLLTSKKTVYIHFRSAKFWNASALVIIWNMQSHLLTAIHS